MAAARRVDGSGEQPLEIVEAGLRSRFGADPARASVSFVGVEPIEILRFCAGGDVCTYASLGMSRHPMTGAGDDHVDAAGPRAELVLRVRDGAERYPDLWRSLAVLAAAPAVESVVHRSDTTLDLVSPLAAGSRWTGVVVADEIERPIDVPSWSAGVAVLEVVPATADELAWARVHGAAALRERWADHGTELLDPDRAPVPLA